MRITSGRRWFLTAIGAAGTFLATDWRTCVRAAATDTAPERLIGLFEHRDSARAIGSVYLAAHPEEADVSRLLELINRADGGPPFAPLATDTARRAWIRERQTQDFAAGRIVNLDGWLLSATEVRICALAALS